MQICRSPFFKLLRQKIMSGFGVKNTTAHNHALGDILGQIPDLWGGDHPRCLKLTSSGVVVITDKSPNRKIPFEKISGPSQAQTDGSFAAITITLHNSPILKLVGVNPAQARKFSDALNDAWLTLIKARINNYKEDIDLVSKAIKRLPKPNRYPSACLLQPFVERAKPLAEIFLPQIKMAIPVDQYQKLQTISAFYDKPDKARMAAIDWFIKAELRQMKTFFDTIEENPLTPEQRLAVITDEDATLVLAAAGSGKTSVIVAKAAYLIERKIRAPDEILLISFTNNAAGEVSERIKKCYGVSVNVRTFHSLGNKIIAEVKGNAPAPAPHASNNKIYIKLLREIIMEYAAKLGEVAGLLTEWFCEFFHTYKSDFDFKSQHEYYSYIRTNGFWTFGGECVKSFEELTIANWLYRNQIKYEYEPVYEHPLPDSGRQEYTPDFRLTESGIYIEHFGVRKKTNADGTWNYTTAPFVDCDEYLKGMDWKRDVHKTHGTTLIETYSYEHAAGQLTRGLAKKLKPLGVKFAPIPSDRLFERLEEMGEVDSFTRLLGTFLKHFKSARLTISDCRKRNRELELGPRGAAFLKIFKFIFDEYQVQLGQRIDFEDMIIRATDYVTSGQYQSPFRHILIDEFQDISKSPADLLRALKAQHKDARIFAVGDDWQSIYRFAGADVHLMRNFGAEFGGQFADKDGVHKTIDLGRTFRSVDKIALPARQFILENPTQLDKEVKAKDSTDAPSIFVVWSEDNEGSGELNNTLKHLNTQGGQTGKRVPVLLLGRYKNSNPQNIMALENKYTNLSIEFKTIHGAKGLEADHVIILRVNAGLFGLPSEIVDDPLLNMVLPTPERFHHAEERRVFYVALTRARKSVTILASKDYPSTFVKELLRNPDYGVIEIGGDEAGTLPCPKCGGRMVKRTGPYSTFWACVNYPRFGCLGKRNIMENSSEA